MSAASERTLVANGLRLHYRDWGGPGRVPALAFHGFALNAHSWDEVAPELGSRVRWLAFDQRGHGLSDRAARMSEYSRDHMVGDIRAIADGLGLHEPVLIGHSMGGMNALAFAGRYPERVRALVLVDVGPEVSVDGAGDVLRFVAGPYELDSLDAWVEHTCAYYPWRSPERIRSRLAVSLTRTPEGRFAKQYDERFRQADFAGVEQGADDLWELAAAIRCPTLLLHGGDSPVLTREMAERFAERIPRLRLVSIPGAGHSVAGDAPEAFVKEVGTFFDEVLLD